MEEERKGATSRTSVQWLLTLLQIDERKNGSIKGGGPIACSVAAGRGGEKGSNIRGVGPIVSNVAEDRGEGKRERCEERWVQPLLILDR